MSASSASGPGTAGGGRLRRGGLPLAGACRRPSSLKAGPAQYQALALLAATVWWLSRERGHPEAGLLDEMASALGTMEQAVHKQAGSRPVTAPAGARAADGFGHTIIVALRELLPCVPVPAGDAGGQDATEPGGPGALPAVTELVQDPAPLARYQSLALLSGTVKALSRESGPPEAEILDRLTGSSMPGA